MHRCNNQCRDGFHYHSTLNSSYEAQLAENIESQRAQLDRLKKLAGSHLADDQPRPDNYSIKNFAEHKPYLVLWINYPNCTNYNGDKILVVQATIEQLVKTKHIDPHFSEQPCAVENALPSPIARFVPTEEGWLLALAFVRSIIS